MKPPIEYRPKTRAAKLQQAYKDIGETAEVIGPILKAPDFIVIRRDRAKYNAYMRAYRAKKKSAKGL